MAIPLSTANLPLFDVTAKMRILLVPSDVPVGTVIYRLRATDSDFDYPLHFDTNDATGRAIVIIRDLPCSRNKTHCSANVHLKRQLRDGMKLNFRISVTDSSGDSTVVDCTIKGTSPSATAARTAAFPRFPGVIFAPEDAEIGSVLDYIIARKNSKNARHVHLEIWGSDHFDVKHSLASPETVNATIVLVKPLDFENQAVHRIQILATDPYVDPEMDTRNVAGLRLEVAVVDVQDTPPRFLIAPPATRLNASLVPGNVILRVSAEDGDRGAPRSVRYGLLSSGNPFTPFFRMDETTGELKLARPLKQLAAITQSNAPLVVLQVLASEIVLPPDDDPLNSESTAEVALILETLARGPPRFESNQYVARIPEGSSLGTALQFSDPWVPRVKDDDMGRSGFFALTLEGDNGTFEVSPNIAERSANFVIQVKNNRLLDYEKYRELNFKVVATEVGTGGGDGGASSTASATIYIDDVNDNPPVFLREEYFAELQENATAGTSVVQVQATDVDTGVSGRVSYTRLLGPANASLSLDAMSGVITVAMNHHTFDREAAPEHRLYVEARDEDGNGLRATVPLTIKLLDINDEVPIFSRPAYEFFLDRDGKNFTSEAYVEAVDKDSEPPNNVVRYEIVSGNYENKFFINEVTGRITLREPLTKDDGLTKSRRRLKRQSGALGEEEEEKVIMLNVRAYDLGVPHRWSQAVVRVYPRGSNAGSRYVLFVVPKTPLEVEADREHTEKMLTEITGGKVTLVEVRPHQDQTRKEGVDRTKSDVLARVIYPANAVIDVNTLRQLLVVVSNTSTSTHEGSTTVVSEVRSEIGPVFWVLLFFALFFVILVLILLCCCACVGCPLYGAHRKRFRIESTESLRPMVQETVVGTTVEVTGEGEAKAEDADAAAQGPREAWTTTDQKGQQKMPNGHRGYRRGSMDAGSEDGESLLDRGGGHGGSPHHGGGRRHGPNLVYSRRLQQKWSDEYPVYVEDMEDSPGRRRRVGGPMGGRRRHQGRYPSMGDPHHPHGYPHRRYADDLEEDTDSIRRHELERGSDHGGRPYGGGVYYHHGHYRSRAQDSLHQRREGMFRDKLAEEDGEDEEAVEREGRYVREGDAEILRLVTRGGAGDEEGDVTGAGRGGKEILLRRFMEDQGGEASKEKAAADAAPPAAEPPQPPPPPPPPPPVPSQAAATQTDVHAETQTEPYVPSEEEEISAASSKGSRKKKHCHKRSRSRHRSKKCCKGAEVKSPIQEEKDGVENGSQQSDPPLYVDNKSSILRKMILRSTDAEPSDAEPVSGRVRKISEGGGVAGVRKSFSEPYRTGSVNNSYRLNTGGSVSDGEGEERKDCGNRRGSLPDISSRYMDWYKELMEGGGPRARAEKKAVEAAAREAKIARRRREWLQERSDSLCHRVTLNVPHSEMSKAGSLGNSARATEDDIDSGIALNSQALGVPVGVEQQQMSSPGGGAALGGIVGGGKKLLEKKSVFAIAYDDMQTKQLRSNSISPPY
ncbi:cadherin-86C [Hetaerina americana]|uniref:cadherin-86C n=1 Tax=Hetaerina americana TaxID=62018 RepID=UPI003A7F5952